MRILLSIIAVFLTLNANAWYITGTANIVVVNNSGVSRTWTFTGKRQSDNSLPVTVNQYIADGATVTVTINNLSVATGDGSNPDGTSPNTYWPLVFANDTCGYNFQTYTFPFYTTVPTFNLTLLPSCTYSNSTPPCTTNGSLTIRNNTTVDQYFAIMDNFGNVLSSSAGVAAGDTRVFGYSGIPCGNLPLHAVNVVNANVQVTSTNVYTMPTNYPGSGGTNTTWTINPDPGHTFILTNADGSLILNGKPPSIYNPTNQTSGIIWTAGTSTNAPAGIQQGFSALYDADTKGFDQLHQDATVIQSLIISNTRVLSGMAGAFTNGLSLSGTNILGTNVATELTLRGMSNLFAGSGESTNVSGTNWIVEVGVATNYSAAVAGSHGASTELSTAEGSMQSFLDLMNPVSIDDGFAAPNMVIDFSAMGFSGAGQMDLNPMNDPRYAAIFTASKNLWAWILAVFYMIRCARDASNAISLCNQARGVVVTSPTTKKTYS